MLSTTSAAFSEIRALRWILTADELFHQKRFLASAIICEDSSKMPGVFLDCKFILSIFPSFHANVFSFLFEN